MPQAAGRSSDVILLKSTAAILAAAMFFGIVRRLQLRWLARRLWLLLLMPA